VATMPMDEGFVSVREYLRTSYSPDCEYVDGRIEECNLGEKEHSILQLYFAFLFRLNRSAWESRIIRSCGLRLRRLDFVFLTCL